MTHVDAGETKSPGDKGNDSKSTPSMNPEEELTWQGAFLAESKCAGLWMSPVDLSLLPNFDGPDTVKTTFSELGTWESYVIDDNEEVPSISCEASPKSPAVPFVDTSSLYCQACSDTTSSTTSNSEVNDSTLVTMTGSDDALTVVENEGAITAADETASVETFDSVEGTASTLSTKTNASSTAYFYLSDYYFDSHMHVAHSTLSESEFYFDCVEFPVPPPCASLLPSRITWIWTTLLVTLLSWIHQFRSCAFTLFLFFSMVFWDSIIIFSEPSPRPSRSIRRRPSRLNRWSYPKTWMILSCYMVLSSPYAVGTLHPITVVSSKLHSTFHRASTLESR